MAHKLNKESFEKIYREYNHRELVTNDPLRFLYKFDNIKDREIVGLIASSLAYGRVAQIQKSVNSILLKIPSPYSFIVNTSSEDSAKIFDGFKHRFTTMQELVLFFEGIKNTIAQFGSLEKCFMEGYQETDSDIFQALFNFSRQLLKGSPCRNSLIPDPEKKSAFKRLNLFLRWMIRSDEVDPGGWKGVQPAKLIYPVDTHIHRLSLALGLTKKNQNDHRTAAEITDSFREISPDDPVKYDFSLTSLSIGTPGIDNFIDQHKLLT